MPIQTMREYLEFIRSPWGEMQFRLTWEQLAFAQGLRVLDFGSGMGKTADYLAGGNDVTAVEPSAKMLAHRYCEHEYRQIHGGLDDLPNGPFDLVVCHNVLEFVDDRERYLGELARRVAPGGRMSIVKHNLAGKALRQAVAYDDPAGALALVQGEQATNHFGAIRMYGTDELIGWAVAHGFACEQYYGIRSFHALRPDNDGWADPAWVEAMHALEQHTAQEEPYRGVAFFHHVVLRKTVGASSAHP